MKKTSLKDVFNANRGIKDQALLLQIVRPFGTCLAWVAIRIGLQPIHITYTGFLLTVFAFLSFAFGAATWRAYLGALLILWQTLDTTDGSMARVLQKRSNYGGFVDYLGGIFLLAFLQLGIGIGLLRIPEGSLNNAIEGMGLLWTVDPYFILILAAFSSGSAILVRLILKVVQVRFGKENADYDKADFKGASLAAKFIRVVKEVENLGGFQILLVFFGAVFHFLECLVLFYFVLNVSLLVTYTVKVCVSLRNHHSYIGN
jgi:hypothetical protein